MTDSLSGVIDRFEDEWAAYAAVFEQFKAEESEHDEEELELLLAVIQDEVDDYLRRRGLTLSEREEYPYDR